MHSTGARNISSLTVSSALAICFAGPLSLLHASASSDRVSLRLGGSILSWPGCMSQSAVLLSYTAFMKVPGRTEQAPPRISLNTLWAIGKFALRVAA